MTKDVKVRIDTKGGKQAAQSVDSVGASLKKLGGIVAGLAIAKLASDFTRLYQVQQQAERNLESVIRSTGGAAGYTANELKKYASEMQALTNFGDEVIIQGQAVLATFTSIGRDAFKPATEAAMNMSQVMGTDLKSSMIQLGKALNDPIQGVTALRRVGVSFNEQQLKQIETLQKSGDLLGAQTLILKELEKEFGGAAKAAADPMKQLANMWGDLKEQMGGMIVEILKPMMPLFQEIIKVLQAIIPVITPIIQQIAGVLQPIIQKMIPHVTQLLELGGELVGNVLKAAAPLIQVILTAIGYMMPILTKLIGAVVKISEALAPVVEQYASMLADMLPDLLPLIDSLVNLLVELAPALMVILPLSARMMADGMKFMHLIVTPLIDSLKWIIDNGAAVVKWVNKIFGGEEKAPVKRGMPVMGEVVVTPGGGGAGTTGTPEPTTGKGGKGEDRILKQIELERLKTELMQDEYAKTWAVYDLDVRMYRRMLELKKISQDEYDTRAAIARKERDEEIRKQTEGLIVTTQGLMQSGAEISAQQIAETAQLFVDSSVSGIDVLNAAIQQNQESLTGIFSNMGTLMEESFEGSKAVAIAQATISTWVAAAKALEAGPILGPILMATTIAAGLAQVAKIVATRPGSRPSGGSGGVSMPNVSGAGMQGARVPAPGASAGRIMVDIGGDFRIKGSDLFLSVNKQLAAEMSQTL